MLKVGVTFTPTMRTELFVRAKGGYVLINHTAPETNQDVTESNNPHCPMTDSGIGGQR